ncbi:MAG: MmcQ/YjbR family DNA-binding protein [Deltaproteobacteria bacterium]|nr:MAG: MmcQ/YjbR family DNA-binding protein [Deltaproteobacteria bacterium]
MNFETLLGYLLQKPGATEDFPFDNQTLVIKVGGKMFALVGIKNDPLRINLKCDPIKAEFLRQQHPAVLPGYHMNKRHWNTVVLDDTIADAEIFTMIDDSYDLVVQGLPKVRRPKV